MIDLVMLCNHCRILDFDAASDESIGALHHECYADLVASAKGGCQLCWWIYDDWMNTSEQYGDDGRLKCQYNGVDSSLYWYLGDLNGDPIAVTFVCTADGMYCSRSVQSNLSSSAEPVHSQLLFWPFNSRIADYSRGTTDDPMSELLYGRHILYDAGSDDFFLQAKDWIDTCTDEHVDCVPHDEHVLPTRVVDVGDSETPPSLFLTHRRTKGRWTTLSHCWGDVVPLETKSCNIDAFCHAIPLEIIPLLFQDAIFTTRRLGYRYLWIDSLCIIQDSEDDWEAESADMGRIFKEACLTIAAEAAKDSSIGLFESTNKDRYRPQITIASYSALHAINGLLHVERSRDDDLVPTGPLSSRAWVLQEDILSARVLRFCAEQVWWQCREVQRNESFPNGNASVNVPVSDWDENRFFPLTGETKTMRRVTQHLQNTYFQPRQCWYRTVNQYCYRGITYEKDLLPAISGIAKEYRRHIGQEYIAGLWSGDMHLGLLWSSPGQGAMKAKSYVAPSWSWAALRVPPSSSSYESCDVYDSSLISNPPEDLIAQIRCASVTPHRQGPFGRMIGGSLTVTGPSNEMCRCNIAKSFLDCYELEDAQQKPLTYKLLRRGYDVVQGDTPLCKTCTTDRVIGQSCLQRSDARHTSCLLLHVATHLVKDIYKTEKDVPFVFALILEKFDENEQYRRIGLAILQETTNTSTAWPERTITIL